MKIPARLITSVKMCDACQRVAALAAIDKIRAQITTILPVAPKAENTVIPSGFRITKGNARIAQGAYKSRLAARGDAPTTTHAARATGTVAAIPQHRAVRALASRR